MSFKILSERLKELGVSYSDFAYGDFKKDDDVLGQWEEVDQYGGEGCGDSWHSVKHFKNHNVFIRIDGYYASHYGTDFDNEWFEVQPKQKTITIYEGV